MKDSDLRDMCRVDLEDEVMLERAHVKVLENEVYTLRQQVAALTGAANRLSGELARLTCACCDDAPTLVGAATEDWI